MKKRYDALEDWYARQANYLRRQFGSPSTSNMVSNWDWTSGQIMCKPQLRGDLDIRILQLQLFNNVKYALANDNKYLIREDISNFPIMNYALKEGPYMPSADAVFGQEDFHMLLKADHDLIYFVVPRDGLTKGIYVESYL